MDAKTCLEKLRLVGVLSFATVDEAGAPQTRNISAIHYEDDAMYFYTAQGKNFCRQLLNDGRVQVLGYTRFKEMIRLSAVAEKAENQQKWIDIIFKEQPYLENVYPGETRDIGIIFEIKNAEIEYFNLGVNPIFRESYVIGAGKIQPKGYVITNACIGCGTCKAGCPQRAITEGTPYVINAQHCLHCGRCEKNCPVNAIERLWYGCNKRYKISPLHTQISNKTGAT